MFRDIDGEKVEVIAAGSDALLHGKGMMTNKEALMSAGLMTNIPVIPIQFGLLRFDIADKLKLENKNIDSITGSFIIDFAITKGMIIRKHEPFLYELKSSIKDLAGLYYDEEFKKYLSNRKRRIFT